MVINREILPLIHIIFLLKELFKKDFKICIKIKKKITEEKFI